MHDLARHLPSPFNADEAAADHYHLFGFNIHPYESVFLGTGGNEAASQQDTDIIRRIEHAFDQAGYRPATTEFSSDYIGNELGMLAHLTLAETHAWEDGKSHIAARVQQQQHRFLSEHLLRWLPSLTIAIQGQQNPFFAAVAFLLRQFVEDHALSLSTGHPLPGPEGWLPLPPALLQSEKTALRHIARYLCTPAHSGIYLSRDTIASLARHLQLPRGFGSRQQLMENLFQASVQYDQLPDLLASLRTVCEKWQSQYEAALDPVLEPFVAPWMQRTTTTSAILEQIGREATPPATST